MAKADREKLNLLLIRMLGIAKALKRDECGDDRIIGKRGHIYSDGESYLLYLQLTTRGWNTAKQKLSRFQVSQGGDAEGCIRLKDPTDREAILIRRLIGVRKRMPASNADRLRRYQF